MAQSATRPSAWPPLTISLPELLYGGSDDDFRDFLNSMLKFAGMLQRNRELLAKQIKLTSPQFAILMRLSRIDGCETTASRLAAQLDVSVAFVVMETKKLAELELIQRRPNPLDGRSVIIGLSSKGKQKLRSAASGIRKRNNLVFASLVRSEMLVMARAGCTLVRNYEEANLRPHQSKDRRRGQGRKNQR